MTIQELKTQIEHSTVKDSPMIFIDDENKFLSTQYIKAISKVKNLEINYIQSIEDVLSDSSNFFTCEMDEQALYLNVLYTPVYEWGNIDITRATNLIVVVTKFKDKDLQKSLSDYIVTMPILEDWQIRDYVYSLCEGVDIKDLDMLISLCGKNIWRLQQELDKFSLFNINERKFLFNSFIRDGALSDLSSYNIFNFTNAIASKDLTTVKNIYKKIDQSDITDFYLLTVILKTFRNILMVNMNSNPTPETTGLTSGQLYAIKKIPKAYTSEQLLNIFTFLCDVDRQVKEGELPANLVVDYITLKILSM